LLLATLVYITFVASFPRDALVGLSPLALGVALGVALAPVQAGVLGRRLAMAAPFAIVLGLANPWLDTRPVIEVGGVVISAGWLGFGVIVLKVLLSVTAVLLLTALASPPRLAQALRKLAVPAALVMQLELLGRYLEILRAEALAMRRARELRSAGARQARRPRVVATMLGVLLHRAMDRGERIHRAMLVRGFRGELRSLEPLDWRVGDTLLLMVTAAFCAAVRFLPLAEWLGRRLFA